MTINQNSNQQPTTQSTQKMGKLVLLPIDAITSQEQVRKTFLNIDELAASILKEGLQMPITVTAPNANGQHTIIQGERRWRACKHAGLTHIQAIIKEEPQSEIQRIIAQLTENIQREDMSCEEIGQAIAELRKAGLSIKQISNALGKSDQWASVYHAVAYLPEYIQDLKGNLAINDPYVLRPLKNMYEEDAVITKELVETALKKKMNFTRSAVNELQKQLSKRLTLQKAMEQNEEPTTATEELIKNIKKKFDQASEALPNNCKPSNNVRVYCWVRPHGFKENVLGMIATNMVTKDPEFACVWIEGKIHVVPAGEIVIAGVKDSADEIDDLH